MGTSARIEELQSKFDENPRRYFAPLANELRKMGDTAQAIAICRAHLPGQPGHVSGHIVLAQALYEAGDVEAARVEFEAAIGLDPENLIALRHMGDIARQRGDVEDARAWYQRVLDADPRNQEIAAIVRGLGAPPNDSTATRAEPAASLSPDSAEAAEAPAHADSVPPPLPESFTFAPQPATSEVAEASTAGEEFESSAHSLEESLDEWLSAESPAAQSGAPEQPIRLPGETESAVENLFALPSEASPVQNAGTDFDGVASHGEPDRAWDAQPAPAFSDLEAAPEDWFDSHPDQAMAADDRDVGAMGFDAVRADDDLPTTESDIESLFDSAPASAAAAGDHDAGPVRTESEWELPPVQSAPASAVDDAFTWPGSASDAGSDADTAQAFASDAQELSENSSVSSRRDAELEMTLEGTAESEAGMTAEFSADAEYDASAESEAVSASDAFSDSVEPAGRAGPVDSVASAEGAAPGAWESAHDSEATVQPLHLVREEPELAGATDSAEIAAIPPGQFNTMRQTPSYSQPPREAPAHEAPFATETLAELYLQQGFRSEALGIYRQLLARNPSDDTLRNRIAALEAGASSDALDAAPGSARVRAGATGAQSVRSFFGRLARRAPNRRRGAQGGSSAPQGHSDFDSARSTGGAEETHAARASDDHSDSTLTRLFNAAPTRREDDAAADALASAFSAEPREPGTRATRAAERELSLDHLFRDNSSASSMDAFYGTPRPPSQAGSPTAADAEGDDAERAADIREFNSWLEGLKKK